MEAPDNPGSGKARTRYKELEDFRRPYLDRAKQAASLTLPYIQPPEGHTAHSELPTPYQSLGARGVTNLAAKLALTLFPPHQPFFSHKIDRFLAARDQLDEAAINQIQSGLSAMERAGLRRAEASNIRPLLHETFLRTLIGGNSLLYTAPKKGEESRVYRLDQFVARRTAAGKLMELVTKEEIARSDLPESIQENLPNERSEKPSISLAAPNDEASDTFYLYRWCERQPSGKWTIIEEVEGLEVQRKENIKDDDFRYIHLRFNIASGETYGRGYVEQYLGDLVRLEALSKAVSEGAAAAALVYLFVNPNGITDIVDVQEAENLDILSGRADDLSVARIEKLGDFRFVLETISGLERRLEYAFLLHTAIQRSGERVTAEEIRTLAEELENSLGGVYSLFSTDLQMPLARMFTNDVSKEENYPKLPEGLVSTKIVTGVDALGRAHEGRKLRDWLHETTSVLGPEAVMREINPRGYMERTAIAQGIDHEGLFLTEEQKQQAQMDSQMANVVDKAAGPVAGQAAKAMMME